MEVSLSGKFGDLGTTNRNRRGFTDHEHLDEQQLIHMNGRVYDFNLGRFMSVDPLLQAPTSTQSINPYSYIMNNPMAGTDPTGYYAVISNCTRLCGMQMDRNANMAKLMDKLEKFNAALDAKIGQVLSKTAGAGGNLNEVNSEAEIAKPMDNKSVNNNLTLIDIAQKHFVEGVPLEKLNLTEQQTSLMNEFGNSLTDAFTKGSEWNASYYIKQVETKGRWDFKNRREYKGMEGIEQFGNFAFGATSAAWAAGASHGISNLFEPLTANIAMLGAGLYQEYKQSNLYDESNGHWYDLDIDINKTRIGPLNPGTQFGDNPSDGSNVMDGHIFFNKIYNGEK